MTESERPGTDGRSGGFEQPLGEEEGRRYEEAVEHEVYPDVDFEDNELRAAGQTCVRCGRVIGPEDDVRRTASGAYEHEVCPGPPVTAGN